MIAGLYRVVVGGSRLDLVAQNPLSASFNVVEQEKVQGAAIFFVGPHGGGTFGRGLGRIADQGADPILIATDHFIGLIGSMIRFAIRDGGNLIANRLIGDRDTAAVARCVVGICIAIVGLAGIGITGIGRG